MEGELKFGREEYTGGNVVFPGEGGRANFRPVVGTLSPCSRNPQNLKIYSRETKRLKIKVRIF